MALRCEKCEIFVIIGGGTPGDIPNIVDGLKLVYFDETLPHDGRERVVLLQNNAKMYTACIPHIIRSDWVLVCMLDCHQTTKY